MANWIKQNIILVVVIILLTASIGLSLKNWNESRHTKYVDTIRLFNEFQMTIDLEEKETPLLNDFKIKMDSLKLVYDLLKTESEKETLGLTMYQFDNEYRGYREQSNKKINDIVWARLNKIIDKFGAENNLVLLFGANGMGNILYANPGKDATSGLIEYCNKEYKNEK